MKRLPPLPKFLSRKIYKTSQTRGADDDEIFQNRVSRNSTVLIPYEIYDKNFVFPEKGFENGYIVLITPEDFFKQNSEHFNKKKLNLGKNLLIFYTKRSEWTNYNPLKNKLKPANKRKENLGGEYVARIANTTSVNDKRINHGFSEKKSKGAGIRFYEYCSNEDLNKTKIQLEALFWLSGKFKEQLLKTGMKENEILIRREKVIEHAKINNFLDFEKLKNLRIINNSKQLICPLCRETIDALNFFSKETQQTGREKHDLTITNVNLFHLKELRTNEYNHKLYNLGWGHHHCNIVLGDKGIEETLKWMKKITSNF